MGRPSDPTAFAFVIAFIATATSSSMDSVTRRLVIGLQGKSRFDVAIKLVGFRV